MSDLNPNPSDSHEASNPDPVGDFKEYTGPTQASETPKTESDKDSKFGAEILSILDGFGEDIKRISKSVSEYIDKESFGKAAESVRDALSDAGEGIKRTTQNMGEKLEEERIQRAIRELKDYTKKTGKSISDLFKDEPPTPVEDLEKRVAKAAEDLEESLQQEANDTAERDINFENTFGG